ncbi:hypothetical protein ECG_04338 [Echinococcus granulosus]|uniref:Transmembrane protein n=1 Tax=Echinococcus granulosus TaxID=6210 RepID=A0A068WI75_ECHGR|nr:hypothetical protein ECG_04338 [Echinococcus granulosus]CDS17380.1 hypothetical protein EgrG_001012900 [Echinococcus granulosus]
MHLCPAVRCRNRQKGKKTKGESHGTSLGFQSPHCCYHLHKCDLFSTCYCTSAHFPWYFIQYPSQFYFISSFRTTLLMQSTRLYFCPSRSTNWSLLFVCRVSGSCCFAPLFGSAFSPPACMVLPLCRGAELIVRPPTTHSPIPALSHFSRSGLPVRAFVIHTLRLFCRAAPTPSRIRCICVISSLLFALIS